MPNYMNQGAGQAQAVGARENQRLQDMHRKFIGLLVEMGFELADNHEMQRVVEWYQRESVSPLFERLYKDYPEKMAWHYMVYEWGGPRRVERPPEQPVVGPLYNPRDLGGDGADDDDDDFEPEVR